MEKAIAKEILKNKLNLGTRTAIEYLYIEYGDMLYGYILPFIPDEGEAENLLVGIFTSLAGHLKEAGDSNLSVFCWLQTEARKIILRHKGQKNELAFKGDQAQNGIDSRESEGYYFALLREATYEQKWVFRELFLIGRQKEELAIQLNKDVSYIGKLLRESLVIINKNLV